MFYQKYNKARYILRAWSGSSAANIADETKMQMRTEFVK